MHNVNTITLKLMYHQCTSNYIKSEINVYTEINAYNANNEIGYASNAGNQIGLEINIYTENNVSSASK